MLVLLQKHPSKQGDTVGFQYTEKTCESMCLCVCVLVCSDVCNTFVRSQFLPATFLRFIGGMKTHFLTLGIECPGYKSVLVRSALGTAGTRRFIRSLKRNGKSHFKMSKTPLKVIGCHFCLVY